MKKQSSHGAAGTDNLQQPVRRAGLISRLGAVVLALATLAWAPLAFGETIEYTDTYEPALTDWTDVLSVPKFDPSIGKLLEVQVTATAIGTTEIRAINNNNYLALAELDAGTSLAVAVFCPPDPEDPGNLTEIVRATATGSIYFREVLPPYGVYMDYVIAGNTASQTCTPGGPAFDKFVGVGLTSFPVTADGGATGSSSGNTTWDATTIGEASITVRYVYELWDPKVGLVKTADKPVITAGADSKVTYTVTAKNTGNAPLEDVTVTDDNGTPLDPSDDFNVGTVDTLAPGAEQTFDYDCYLPSKFCVTINGVEVEPSTLVTQLLPAGSLLPDGSVLQTDAVLATFRQSRNISDNTYGLYDDEYPKGHTFDNLLGSDKAQFRFTDKNGNVVLEFIADYISAASKTIYPSGYGTLGVTGGDGSMLVGSAASVLGVSTTISDNLNQDPVFYGFTVNSPPPPEPYPGWDYHVGYSVIIDASVFGGLNGYGGVEIVAVHNSPPKTGYNAYYPEPCEYCVVNTAKVTASYEGTPVIPDPTDPPASAEVCITLPPCWDGLTSISADFNSTVIDAGRYVWFNSVVKVDKRNGAVGTVEFNDVTVTLPVNGVPTTLQVPPGRIVFSATATSASTLFDGERWITTVPKSFTGNVFLTGLAYPSPGLPGGIKGVKWTGNFSSNLPTGEYVWKWAAAVYENPMFGTDYDALGVKPIESSKLNPYLNADKAGTPENFKLYLKPGARGTGGTSYTGSYTTTAKVLTPCPLH